MSHLAVPWQSRSGRLSACLHLPVASGAGMRRLRNHRLRFRRQAALLWLVPALGRPHLHNPSPRDPILGLASGPWPKAGGTCAALRSFRCPFSMSAGRGHCLMDQVTTSSLRGHHHERTERLEDTPANCAVDNSNQLKPQSLPASGTAPLCETTACAHRAPTGIYVVCLCQSTSRRRSRGILPKSRCRPSNPRSIAAARPGVRRVRSCSRLFSKSPDGLRAHKRRGPSRAGNVATHCER